VRAAATAELPSRHSDRIDLVATSGGDDRSKEQPVQKLDWVGFWNTDHHIYVNHRHKIVHDQLVTRDIAAYLPENSAVLDFGCGKNFAVHEMMDKAAQLILCDAASSVREELQGRFPDHPRIMVTAPKELDLFPGGSFDVVVMHSVAQYLPADDMRKTLASFDRLLKDDGKLLLGDIVSGEGGAVSDAYALLTLARKEQFFGAAVIGLAKTAISPYRKLRQELGLTNYEEAEIRLVLDRAGFTCERMARNIGHNQRRTTYLCRKRPRLAEVLRAEIEI
jgi:ubiquinone/menaquinone biosynthesis C-methylase UbiE